MQHITSTRLTKKASPLRTSAMIAQNSAATHNWRPCPVKSVSISSYETHSPVISSTSKELVISYRNKPISAAIVLSNGGVSPIHGSPVTFSKEKKLHDNAASSDKRNPTKVQMKTQDLQSINIFGIKIKSGKGPATEQRGKKQSEYIYLT